MIVHTVVHTIENIGLKKPRIRTSLHGALVEISSRREQNRCKDANIQQTSLKR